MAVNGFIPLTVLKVNNTDNLERIQGVTSADIRFAMIKSTGQTLLYVEDRQKVALDNFIVQETPAEILALVEATGDTENKLDIYAVTALKHGGTSEFSPAKDMLLNSQYFKNVVTISTGTRFAYNVEEHKTPWIIEVEDELLPSATATTT